jgi:hypothetical protein
VIETTPTHPFFIKNKGWMEAGNISVSDISFTITGQELSIVEITRTGKVEKVYNFSVDEEHNYFVGEVGVLVHNGSYEPSFLGKILKSKKELEEIAEQKKLEQDYEEVMKELESMGPEVIDAAKSKISGYDNSVKYKELFAQVKAGKLNNPDLILELQELKKHGGKGVYITLKNGQKMWVNWQWNPIESGKDGKLSCDALNSLARSKVGMDSNLIRHGNAYFKTSKMYNQVEVSASAEYRDGDILVLNSTYERPNDNTAPNHFAIFTGEKNENGDYKLIEMQSTRTGIIENGNLGTYNVKGGYYMQKKVIEEYQNYGKINSSSIAVYRPKVTKDYFYKKVSSLNKTPEETNVLWNKYKEENPDNHFDSSEWNMNCVQQYNQWKAAGAKCDK